MKHFMSLFLAIVLCLSGGAQELKISYYKDALGLKGVGSEKKAVFKKVVRESTDGMSTTEFVRTSDSVVVSRMQYNNGVPVGHWIRCDIDGNMLIEIDYDEVMCKQLTYLAQDGKMEDIVKDIKVDSSEKKSEVFTIVEEMPEFSGGQMEMYNYLAKNIIYPKYAKDNGIQGTVYMSFIILESGSIDEVCVMRSASPLLDLEAIRVVKNMPQWKPGVQRGKPVKVSFLLPLKFALR